MSFFNHHFTRIRFGSCRFSTINHPQIKTAQSNSQPTINDVTISITAKFINHFTVIVIVKNFNNFLTNQSTPTFHPPGLNQLIHPLLQSATPWAAPQRAPVGAPHPREAPAARAARAPWRRWRCQWMAVVPKGQPWVHDGAIGLVNMMAYWAKKLG